MGITSFSREHVTHALYICYMTMSCICLSLIKFMLCYVLYMHMGCMSYYFARINLRNYNVIDSYTLRCFIIKKQLISIKSMQWYKNWDSSGG